jgi:cytoskeletal protein RodZ
MSDGSGHKLGEVLRAAREAKGVDLTRVERDTKIRARYLTALEGGDYRDLPSAVYTKGFLRNYGLYLGLDTEYLIDLYRLESSTATGDRVSVAPPPRPIAVRRSRGFVLTPNVVVAALLTVFVVAIGAYLASQLIAFAGTPRLQVTDPQGRVAAHDGDRYTFRGVTAANARVTVTGPRENPVVDADEDGVFVVEVLLVPGNNLITLEAFDHTTGRTSAEVRREITVMTALPSSSPGTPTALSVALPEDGASTSGAIAVGGTAAPAAAVTVAAEATAATTPTFTIVNGAGQPVTVPSDPPAAPDPVTLTADATGAFAGELRLAAGTWRILVTGPDGEPVTRQVTVTAPAGLGGTLVLSGGDSYLELDEDGARDGVSGTIVTDGTTVPLTATRDLRIRAGNAGAVTVTINGIRIGPMGASGAVVEWRVTRR